MLTGLHLLTTEFILIATIILSLGVAAFADQGGRRVALMPSCMLLPLMALGMFFLLTQHQSGVVFSKELLVVDGVSQFAKFLILLLVSGAIIIAGQRIFNADKKFNPHRSEYFTTLLISTFGMMIMVSANDLISFYMGLEIQSLALYILIAFRRADSQATEASLKYLILGAVGSGLFLYGASLLFGIAGGISYEILHSFAFMSGNNLVFLIGVTLILTAIFFKLSAAPFHMWTPDVYQGAPIFVTAFVATAPKVAAIFGLLRMIGYAFSPIFMNIQSVIIIASILSLIVGAIMAVRQTSLLRLVAYSTITHMGYVLLGIAANKNVMNFAVIEYMFIYSLTSFGILSLIGAIRFDGKIINSINDLSGLAKRCPILALIIIVFILSLAGIPPLAGFFIKFTILKSAIGAHFIWAAVVAVLASAVSAFYYLRLIKLVYFDEHSESEMQVDKVHFALSAIIAVFLGAYVIKPSLAADFFSYFIYLYGMSI